MTWNSIWPVGNISVRENRTKGNQNTSYIESTMGNTSIGTEIASTTDHFWNISSDVDGHHRYCKMPGFTIGGSAGDPIIGTGIDGVLYNRFVNNDVGRYELYWKNSDGIYQLSPCVITGTNLSISSTSSYTTITSVPINVYGEIFMYATTGAASGYTRTVRGYFRSDASIVGAMSYPVMAQGNGDPSPPGLKFGNGSESSGLNLRAKREKADSLNWNWIVTYRSL